MTADAERAKRRTAAAVAAAAFVALAALAALDALSPLYAVLAALFVGAVAAWVSRPEAQVMPSAGPAPQARGEPPDGVAALLAALPDPAIALDGEARVVAFNAPALAAVPALRQGEHALLMLRMPAVVEAVRRALATGEAQRAEFSERVPLDRWYEAYIAPARLDAAAGGDRLFLLTLHDLTPMRRIEEMRADFVANASHELRTPLAALSGFIDTLQGSAREDAAARERFLAIMREQASRMARLIDDLLSLSRIELREHIQPEAPVEIIGVLRQVIDGLQPLAQERGVTVILNADAPVTVTGDGDELVRVFENLLENALKYGASGKRVDVTLTRTDEGGVRVAVRDYGPGIAAEHLPRLTERFYRVDVGHSRAEGGTGLGLALVKHILARHRGRLQIESVFGAGATFTVELPARP